MPNSDPVKTRQRILDAATELFSKFGYNGVSTRDIARAAGVNETSIYRCYQSKRQLFIATLDAEFSKVRCRTDLMARLAAASDARAAMAELFEVILQVVLQQPQLVRLVHFSLLEYSDDLDHLYRRHAQQLLRAAGDYMARWPEPAQAQRFHTRVAVFAFIASFVALNEFYPMLAGERVPTKSLQEATRSCAARWYAAVAEKSASGASVAISRGE